nr:hypothetical protein [Tanacetum cinerariifolium]
MANIENKVFDNSLCSNECKKNTDSLNSKIKDLKSELSEANNFIYHYKLAVAQLEGRLTEYKEREEKYIVKNITLEMYRASNLNSIKILTKELEEVKLEKDGLDGKLAANDFRSFLELKDLSWTGLPKFVDDTVTDYSRPSPTVVSTSAKGQNKDSSTSEDVAPPNPPKPFVKFVKPKDSQPESKTKEQETPKKSQVKYAEQYRHSNKRPKGNQKNWNNLKSYQLGPEFVLHKKPCFNCGDFSRLANDCRRRVQRETTRSQKYAYESPSHRYGGHRPHRGPMRPSYRPAGHRPHGPSMNPRRPNMNEEIFPLPIGNFPLLAKNVPLVAQKITLLMYEGREKLSAGHKPNGAHMRPPHRSSGPRPHGDSMRPPFGPAGHRPHSPSMNPRRPTMNGSRNLNPTASSSNPSADQIETLTVESPIPTVSSPVPTASLNDSPEPSKPKKVSDALQDPSWVEAIKPHDESNNKVPKGSRNLNPIASSSNPSADQMETLTVESPIPTVSLPVPTASLNDSSEPSSKARLISKRVSNQEEAPSLDNILSLTNRFEDILRVSTSSDEAIGVEADVSNMEITISASLTPTLRIHKDHPKSQIIGPVDTPIQTRHKSKEVSDALQDPSWVEAMQEELFQFKIQKVWTLVDCPKGVRPIGTKWVLKNKKDERGIVVRNKARLDPAFLAKVYKVEEAMYGLHQAPKAWYGLWYPKASPFDLVAFSDSDYGGASQDHKSTTGGRRFQYLVVIIGMGEYNSNFHPMVDFIAASPLRIETTDEGTHILATVDGIQRTVSESSLRRNLKLRDKDGIVSIPDTELFENLTLIGYNISQNQKLTFQKGQFSHQWKYLIHTIMQCLSPKSTGFNEFSSNIATARVCLATNRTYNFSKMIFDGMVKNVNNKISKFLMYPRQYLRRARIAQSSALPTVADEPASPVKDAQEEEIVRLKERV